MCIFIFLQFKISFFFFRLTACGILVPQPGIEPVPTAVKAPSLFFFNVSVSFFFPIYFY